MLMPSFASFRAPLAPQNNNNHCNYITVLTVFHYVIENIMNLHNPFSTAPVSIHVLISSLQCPRCLMHYSINNFDDRYKRKWNWMSDPPAAWLRCIKTIKTYVTKRGCSDDSKVQNLQHCSLVFVHCLLVFPLILLLSVQYVLRLFHNLHVYREASVVSVSYSRLLILSYQTLLSSLAVFSSLSWKPNFH